MGVGKPYGIYCKAALGKKENVNRVGIIEL